MEFSEAEELARARLALVSLGQPALGAPRRALGEEAEPADVAGSDAWGEVVEVGAGETETPRRPAPARALMRGITAKHLVVVAVLLLCGVGVAVTALARSSATEVPLTPQVQAPASAVTSPSATVASVVRVHVVGAVASPGVVQVPSGAIVHDAIEAAGGLTGDADPATLNLAAPLSDGAQIVIGTTKSPAGELNGPVAAPGGVAEGGALDLNTATAAQLEELPGIGPVTAAAIVQWREQQGRFAAVEELQEISGIGPKTFEKLRDLVRV